MHYSLLAYDFFGVVGLEVVNTWFELNKIRDCSIRNKILSQIQEADSGETSEEELFRQLGNSTGASEYDVKQDWYRLASINWDTVSIVKKYSSCCKTALVSNSPSPLLRSVLRANNLEKLFDFVIISSEVRVAKPNKEIFINLTEVADVQATSVIFIDDNPENVKVATDLAMTAILFTDTSSLDTCLSGLLT